MKKPLASLAIIAFLSTSPMVKAHAEMGMMKISPNAEQQPYDIQFLDTMVMHHEDGIKMFQMAVDKAHSPELKTMAQKMVDDQKKEIPELKVLREKIKPGAPEAINMELMNMNKMDMADMDMSQMKDLSGLEFDRKFLSMTIKHHQSAVDMSDVALKDSQNEDVKKKARMMHDMQKAEIDRMKEMLKKLND